MINPKLTRYKPKTQIAMRTYLLFFCLFPLALFAQDPAGAHRYENILIGQNDKIQEIFIDESNNQFIVVTKYGLITKWNYESNQLNTKLYFSSFTFFENFQHFFQMDIKAMK